MLHVHIQKSIRADDKYLMEGRLHLFKEERILEEKYGSG